MSANIEKKGKGISGFQKYLTLWVLLCMILGVLIGRFLPSVPAFLNRFEYAKVSIPMALLIWLMIYPMMMRIDFQSIKNVGRNPKGLFVTWVVNWLIKPFTMYGIASLFFLWFFRLLLHLILQRNILREQYCSAQRRARNGVCME